MNKQQNNAGYNVQSGVRVPITEMRVPGKPLTIAPLVRAISTTLQSASAAKLSKKDRVCIEDGRFYTVNEAMFTLWHDSPKVTFARWRNR